MSPDERTTIIACSVVVGVIVLLLVRCLCSRRSANIASSEWARSLRSAPRIHELAAPLFLPRAMQRGARGARTHMAALVQHTIFAQLATDALIERDAVMDVPDALDSLCRLVQRSPLTPEQAKTLKGLRVPVSARAALWRAFLVSAEPSGAAARAGPAPVLDPPNLIELDGARCKFEEYREGPARGRLEALLHEWVGANPVSGYRQALNSVTAVVLHVVGDDELLARGVLQAITDKYMCGQLARGALQKIAEVRRLSQFAQLLAFWDPHLACHLADIDIEPELYAVQWVSTLFADSLDMEGTLTVWDAMFALDARFPLFLGVVIMMQLRGRLLNHDFVQCLMVISKLRNNELDEIGHDVDIEFCVRNAAMLWSQAPASLGSAELGPYPAMFHMLESYRTGKARSRVNMFASPSVDVASPRPTERSTLLSGSSGGYGSRSSRLPAPAPTPQRGVFRAVDPAEAQELGAVIDMVEKEEDAMSVVNVNGVSIGVPRRGLRTAGVDEGQADRDVIVSRDVMIREALPVVYLRQLKLSPDVVCVVDIRDATLAQHSLLAELVSPLRCTLCPYRKLTGATAPAAPGWAFKPVEMEVRKRGASDVAIGRSVSHGVSHGGVLGLLGFVDEELGEAAIDDARETSLQLRKFGSLPGLRTTADYQRVIQARAPQLMAARGLCLALYADSFAQLVRVRDVLIRGDFSCVAALSHAL